MWHWCSYNIVIFHHWEPERKRKFLRAFAPVTLVTLRTCMVHVVRDPDRSAVGRPSTADKHRAPTSEGDDRPVRGNAGGGAVAPADAPTRRANPTRRQNTPADQRTSGRARRSTGRAEHSPVLEKVDENVTTEMIRVGVEGSAAVDRGNLVD